MRLFLLPQNWSVQNRNRWLAPRRWLVGLLVALTIWGFVDVRRRGYPSPQTPLAHKTDLTVYTEAGAAFFDGRQPYEVANPRGWTYLYPPMFAMLLAPLHALPTQDQVMVWFFLSLLFCWGCWHEMRRILEIVRNDDATVAATWRRWYPWLGVVAVAVAVIPTLNCLQRGQVGVVKLYLLLLGLRMILGGRSYRSWFAGGIVLAMPIVLKIMPALPVGFLVFLQLAGVLQQRWTPRLWRDSITRRLVGSTAGLLVGLVLFILCLPAMLVGWDANLYHLNTWARFVLTKADDGGVDPRSGNSRSARNQSLQNSVYRLGNFAAYVTGNGPDDRLVENFDAPKMAMDQSTTEHGLLLARVALTLALLALGIRLGRGDFSRLNFATGFALACVTMLVVSPVARGHYFMLLAPATLLVPLWLDRHGWSRAAVLMAVTAPILPFSHYILLSLAGRIGLLGLGTTAWLLAAMVLIARADRAAQHASTEESPSVAHPITLSLPKAA